MLTYFYFDEDIFEDEAFKGIPLAGSTLLDFWQEYGCLGINNNKIEFLTKNLKDKLPPKVYKDWITIVPRLLKFDIELSKGNLSDYNDFDLVKGDCNQYNISTAITVTEYKDCYKKHLDDEFEIICPSTITHSKFFSDSKNFSKKSIGSNESLDYIWATRFDKLTKQVKVITIIDRYLVKSIMHDIGTYDENDKKNHTSLEEFLRRLSKNKTKHTVNIFSSINSSGEEINCSKLKIYINENLLKKKFMNNSNIKVNITLCKNSYFSNTAHDRMIRFGDFHIAEIGNGLDIFRQNNIKNNSFTIKGIEQTEFKSIHSTLCNNFKWKL
ncbi:MIT C-terminal domain-containing protein [Vibrio splendidus]